MRILMVGAGAVGGYFGGRLLEKGEDVTFLVRGKRNQQLAEHGLRIESVNGDVTLKPKTIMVGEQTEPFDVVILSNKAYHLDAVMEDITDYVGESTMILPLLNGISHIDTLKVRFGAKNVIGGLCFIETTLDENGRIHQTSPFHDLVFGELTGEQTDRINRLQKATSGTKANFRLSDNIMKELWHKYLFITTLSGVTTLTRAAVGPILEANGGLNLFKQLGEELTAIAKKMDAPIDADYDATIVKRVSQMGYGMKSSMQRDMEKGLPVEADHLQGYLYQQADDFEIQVPLLKTIYTNLKVYELNRR
ncbi:ketopantoate reductase family protein [Bacillus sp. AK128]